VTTPTSDIATIPYNGARRRERLHRSDPPGQQGAALRTRTPNSSVATVRLRAATTATACLPTARRHMHTAVAPRYRR
jgi:hypothetical protein